MKYFYSEKVSIKKQHFFPPTNKLDSKNALTEVAIELAVPSHQFLANLAHQIIIGFHAKQRNSDFHDHVHHVVLENERKKRFKENRVWLKKGKLRKNEGKGLLKRNYSKKSSNMIIKESDKIAQFVIN